MAGFLDLLARLDPNPRLRGKQFEHICKWFLTNDPTYKSTLRRVWLWDEWPGRWSGDAGIDLVAEDDEGRLWAIQAKAYSPENAVTKADVDKFLSESSRSVFKYRLLIATTDKLHHVARRTINDQEKHVAFVGLSDLLTSEVNWRTNPLDMRASPPPKPAKPREHQREAIRDVVKGFTTSDRGQLIMACGTGKTLTSLFIREKLGAERVLVLVPSLSLLKQTMQVWRVNAKVPFEALPVCSDETVGRTEEDAAVAYTSELGVPVTTDSTEIGAFLRRSGPRVVFSTYQSSPQLAAAFGLRRVGDFGVYGDTREKFGVCYTPLTSVTRITGRRRDAETDPSPNPRRAPHRLSVEAGRSYGAIYGRGGTARYRRAIAALVRSHHGARRAPAGKRAVAARLWAFMTPILLCAPAPNSMKARRCDLSSRRASLKRSGSMGARRWTRRFRDTSCPQTRLSSSFPGSITTDLACGPTPPP